MPRSSNDSILSKSAREAVSAALEHMSCTQIKWKSRAVHFERRGEKIQLSESMLPGWIHEIEPPVDIDHVTIALSDITGLPVPRSVAADLARVQDRLFPRVVTRDAFAGPNRAMCRREVGSDLFASIWISLGGKGLWLTTAELDRWPIHFEEAFVVARANLAKAADAGSVNEISDGHGVLAALVEGIDLSGALLGLESFLPADFARGAHGAIACAPIDGTLLMLPVRPGGGAEGIASIVQISDMLRDENNAGEVQKRLYWARPSAGSEIMGYTLQMLPVTIIYEDGTRRAHVDASGEVKALLRILGEID